ncbi:hypothetical protein ACLI09_13400 [Flavobacterium sp. RHBU_24]|uniref:hypothetical protein n=1 Tax=Flavobacterium sp. RHBU_24 TaxID=3391185 RepID=UPI003984690F
MKKILLFITAAVLTVSCSDDLENSGPGNGGGYVLLKKKVVTPPGAAAVTTQYNYDDNKLTTVTHSDGTNETYTYTNNYITEIKHYQNSSLIEKEVFTYDEIGLATHISYFYDLANPANNHALKYNYTYTGGTVSVTKFSGDEAAQTTPAGTATLSVTIHGNITKYVSGNTTINYGFDTKSSPMREIAGYQAITLAEFEGGANNITTLQVNNSGTIVNTLTTYTYNPIDYPLTSTYTAANGSITSTAYSY